MSEKRKFTKKVSKKKPGVKLPEQKSPTDTSNWDNRVFKTPNGREIIETDQSKKDVYIAE